MSKIERPIQISIQTLDAVRTDPPTPPPFDADGAPLIPCDDLAAAVQKEIDGEWRACLDESRYDRLEYRGSLELYPEQFRAVARRVLDAAGNGGAPAFRMDEILRFACKKRGVDVRAVKYDEYWADESSVEPAGRGIAWGVPSAAACLAALRGDWKETMAWHWKSRLFAVGPHTELLREIASPHEVQSLDALERWRSSWETLNPWHEGGAWTEQSLALRADTGLDVDPLRRAAQSRVEESLHEGEDASWSISPSDQDTIERDRKELRALLQRDLLLKRSEAALPFVLEAAASAALVALPREKSQPFHVLARLGAGRLLRIEATRFPAEKPVPIKSVKFEGFSTKSTWDGGDIRIWIERFKDEELLGGDAVREEIGEQSASS